jgi:diguanylate cyclase (GGDEF)-like protein
LLAERLSKGALFATHFLDTRQCHSLNREATNVMSDSGMIGLPKRLEGLLARVRRPFRVIKALPTNGPHRFAALLVFLITIVVICFIGWGAYTVERRLIASTGYSLVQAASDAASKLELTIAERQGDVEVFAASPIARGHDQQALTAYLHRLLWSYRAYRWLGVTDSRGRLIASTDPSTVGEDRSASSWFQQALKSDGVRILDAQLTAEVPHRLAIRFTAPIITLNGEFRGVFAAVVEIPYLVDLLDRTTRVLQNVAWFEDSHIEYQVLNRDGDLIADSHLREEDRVNLSAMGLPSARLVAGSQRGFVEEVHLRRHLPIITGYAQVNIPQTGSPLRWGILIRVDRDSILKPIRSFLRNLVMISMLVVVPMALLLIWLVRQLYREWLLATQESARASKAESALSARVQALDALVKAANSLASAPNIETQLQQVLEVARTITKARYAALGILDAKKKNLSRCLMIGLDETHARAIGGLPVEGGILSRLVQSEGALRVEDLGTLISGDGLPPYLPLSSFLGISLRCHGELFGQLYLLEKVTSEGAVTAFTDLDEQILLTLSAQAAVSIENLRLLHDSKERAMRDSLTGLLNHSSIQDALIRELARSERESEPLAVLMADLDHFKRINDTYGHRVGDFVICEAARRMGEAARRYDLLARVGGEEFLMILPGCNESTAAEIAERIRSAVGDVTIQSPAGPLTVTMSIGAAVWKPGNAAHAQRLWETADQALYQVKERGRNGIAFLLLQLQGVA